MSPIKTRNFGEAKRLKIVTLVDNEVWKLGLKSSWGLSFYVETDDIKILMDTGGDYNTLKWNSDRLNVDISSINGIFISHWHRDHYGALESVLIEIRRKIPIYVPTDNTRAREIPGQVMIAEKPMIIGKGVFSTGLIEGAVNEHSLVVNVEDKGLVILTGCSHPGITKIIKKAIELSGVKTVYHVLGGLHISSFNDGKTVAEFFNSIGVKNLSPSHCTGEDAKRAMRSFFKGKYVPIGSGYVLSIE
ncbi:hypothetical protein DRN86_04805 [Candidatus Geothermarchaeota archaeon]|nr:MAG: hypothetical protein DRN86_04805 [Candidatus Geothermarchaeota archaeon]